MQPPLNDDGYEWPALVGVVQNIEDFNIYFDLSAAFVPFEVDCADYNAWNIGNLTTSRAMWRALLKDHLDRGPIESAGNECVYPGANSMNRSQKEAVATALSEKVSLIWGPPAVGKTFTVVQLLRELVNRKERVLVTASTHQAVNNLLRKWAKELPKTEAPLSMLRLGDLDQVDPTCCRWTVDMHPAMKDKGNVYKASKIALKLISQAQIIFSTVTGAGLGMLRQDESFDTVMVDEAAQLTCPNTRVATSKAQQLVVLIGDHQQLRATVHNESKKLEFEESLFEKLHKKGYPCVMLDTQYRMHPSLIRFSSTEFYGGNIQSSESVQGITPLQCFPWFGKHHAVSVNVSSGREQRVGTSFSNEEEARHICRVIASILKSQACDACDIGVITGYSGQVRCLKEALAKHSTTKGVSVRTVDGFQGQEREVILFSAVRTGHHVGFLKDKHRMNVMFTRAKRGLAVFGRAARLALGQVDRQAREMCCDRVGSMPSFSLGFASNRYRRLLLFSIVGCRVVHNVESSTYMPA